MLQHREMVGEDSILDVGGIRVGHWTNRRAATGCTVVLAPRREQLPPPMFEEARPELVRPTYSTPAGLCSVSTQCC